MPTYPSRADRVIRQEKKRSDSSNAEDFRQKEYGEQITGMRNAQNDTAEKKPEQTSERWAATHWKLTTCCRGT